PRGRETSSARTTSAAGHRPARHRCGLAPIAHAIWIQTYVDRSVRPREITSKLLGTARGQSRETPGDGREVAVSKRTPRRLRAAGPSKRESEPFGLRGHGKQQLHAIHGMR